MSNSITYDFEDALNRFLPENLQLYSMVDGAARYSLFAGGKRIRPKILLAFYRLCGGKDGAALPFAAAIEMIHTYSLIHDDLPCMDNDDLRRGKPSCHKAFGEDTALLAGDALLTHAFFTASSTEEIPPDRVVRASKVLAEKAGIAGMVRGQAMDLAFEKTTPSGDDICEMYAKKTSCLLQAASMIGCILAGAEEKKVNMAEEYGFNLGLAFQIIDDILDCTADETLLGKPTGSDQKNGKTTFVSLYGLKYSRREAARLTNCALSLLDGFSGDSSELKELTNQLLIREY